VSIDLSGKTDAELDTLIANHERRQAWGAPLLLEALAERSRRRDGGLDLDRTLALIMSAVSEGRYVTYKDVAAQSGRPWDQVRWKVFDHLGTLCIREYARTRAIPSAMVVPEANRADGELKGETLAGFERICLLLSPGEPLRGKALVEQERTKLKKLVAEATI
jgi:hypothetical protein